MVKPMIPPWKVLSWHKNWVKIDLLKNLSFEGGVFENKLVLQIIF